MGPETRPRHTVIDSGGRGVRWNQKGGKTHFISVNGRETKAEEDFLWSGAGATKPGVLPCHAPFADAPGPFSGAQKPLL